jgi:hypothetical protein
VFLASVPLYYESVLWSNCCSFAVSCSRLTVYVLAFHMALDSFICTHCSMVVRLCEYLHACLLAMMYIFLRDC